MTRADAVMGKSVVELCLACVFVFIVALPDAAPLRIAHLRVPSAIRNGSASSVVLDCEYSFEGESPAGLVVKWFFNDVLVYQWIMNKGPQDLKALKGRLNLNYRASDDASSRHRALDIISPSIDLTGEYRCQVSTFAGDASKAKKMVIYVPEEQIELTQVKTEEGSVRLSCEADAVFPRPQLAFIDQATKKRMEGASVRVTDRADRLYDIEADMVIDEAEDETGGTRSFGCELRLPEANYTQMQWGEEYYSDSGAEDLKTAPAAIILVLLGTLAVMLD